MEEILVVGMARTPIGRFGGKFKDMHPADLGAIVIKAALERAGLDPTNIDLVVMGQVIRGGYGQLTAKQAAVKAGVPQTVEAMNVDMVCSSSQAAIIVASQAIKAGDVQLVVAGGMESMSYSFLAVGPSVRWGVKFLLGRELKFVDLMYHDGLTDPIAMRVMGDETEDVINDRGITREELDMISYMSHKRAAEATDRGYFKNEIEPVEIGGELVTEDEGIRRDTSLEKLSMLKPVFRPDGKLTAGNSSQISDGAAAVVLASKDEAEELGLRPIARIAGYAWAALPSERFNEGMIPATRSLLKKLGASIEDFDLFEVNEAFASNPIIFRQEFGVDYDRINVFGGAIAIGHPIGASGARIVITLINALKTKGLKRGIATLCHGSGGGTAVAVEVL